MSQAVSPDLEPSPDLSSPPTGPLQREAGSCQDVPAALGPASSPEGLIHHEASGEMSTVDTHQTEVETPAERQAVECDQPVSLDPETTEDVEVCKHDMRGFFNTCCWKRNQILSCFWFAQSSWRGYLAL